MAPRDPSHPGERAQRIADHLHGIDLSGGASTVGRDGTVIGDAARLRALKNGLDGNPGSSLLDAYRRWQQVERARYDAGTEEVQAIRKALDRLESRTTAATVARRSAREVEERALRKARRKMLARLKAGHSAHDARMQGFAAYIKHGGKLGPAAFGRRVLG